MIPPKAAEHIAAVDQLADDKTAGQTAAGSFIVAGAVLLFAQQDIAPIRADNAAAESAMLGKKGQRHAALRTECHQLRAGSLITEADDTLQIMDGQMVVFFTFDGDNDVFAFFG